MFDWIGVFNMNESKLEASCDQKIKLQKNYSKQKTEDLTLIPGDTKFEKFCWMRGMNYDETRIRKNLSISAEQFDYMDRKANEITSNYTRFVAKTGHMLNLQMVLQLEWENAIKLKDAAEDARKDRKANPGNHKMVYCEANVRSIYKTQLNEIFEKQAAGPLAHGFNQFIKENIVEPTKRKNTKKRLAVLPEELEN